MKKKLFNLSLRVHTLSIFRELLYADELESFLIFIESLGNEGPAEQLSAYADFANSVHAGGGDLGVCVRELVLSGAGDVYLDQIIRGTTPSAWLEESLERELNTLNDFAALTPEEMFGAIEDIGDCGIGFSDVPKWGNSKVRLSEDYRDMISTISTKGYGIFRNCMMFKVADGEVIPVEDPAYKPLEKFYGYRRERQEVLKNTEVLANGGNASNVLLYGDAGTGKSSTVKAAAAAFADKGVRLIEFNKDQAQEIPDIAYGLKTSPLKFIFYIDDLSFTDSDDNFYCLKGILEGNVSGQPSNIVVYATSNRRHLVRESMEDRQGNDIHLNDTLQELMSVSARFGLLITFQKPAKDLYLEIVKEMAEEYGLVYESEEDLFRRAEAFAIRANGRSPRTAKQFVTLASEGMR